MTSELGGTHDPAAQYELWLAAQNKVPKARWIHEVDAAMVDMIRDGSVAVTWRKGEPLLAITDKGLEQIDEDY